MGGYVFCHHGDRHVPTLRPIDTTRLARYPSLAGRTVFVTGGGSGIGASIVAAFAAQGARVAFIDIARAASDALARRIAEAGLPAPWWEVCDVRDVAALQSAIERAAAALGDVSVLVNNVASDERHAMEAVTPDYWDERMAINQRPAFFAIQQGLREGQCLPDLLQGEDIARMVLFLASDDSAMCTAQEFKVDAGWT
jgi:NAD(P)-dependent dehydrogenase (short-subunit alcohol dehydrogenase family)